MSSRAQRVRSAVTVSAFDWALDGFEPAVSDLPPPLLAQPMALPEPEDERFDERRLAEDIEREAFTKGYAQGERAGSEAAATRAEAVLRRLAQTLEELGSLRDQMIHKTERQVVQLALAIAARILHREVEVDRELLVAMARVALDRLGDRSSATIRLNPDDFDAGGVGRIMGHSSVQIVADPSVKRGACVVESDFGQIDVGVESQLTEITAALLGDDSGPATESVHVHADR
jgi:flagellar assembly protein FliH